MPRVAVICGLAFYVQPHPPPSVSGRWTRQSPGLPAGQAARRGTDPPGQSYTGQKVQKSGVKRGERIQGVPEYEYTR